MKNTVLLCFTIKYSVYDLPNITTPIITSHMYIFVFCPILLTKNTCKTFSGYNFVLAEMVMVLMEGALSSPLLDLNRAVSDSDLC